MNRRFGESALVAIDLALLFTRSKDRQAKDELRAAIAVLKACDKFRFGSSEKIGAIIAAILRARRIAGRRK
jgi:hypothetical protein